MRILTSRFMRRIAALCFACLFLMSPVRVSVVLPIQNDAQPHFSVEAIGAQAVPQLTSFDLNGDGTPECVNDRDGVLSIDDCDAASAKVYWQSPAGWKVAQWTFSDLNADGATEITLLVWRPFAPWPIERDAPNGGRLGSFHDAQGQSCHVILIRWSKGSFNELWAGSALANPILSLVAADINGDGDQELVTVQGNYEQPAFFRSGPIAIWKWNGFGFDLVQTIAGSYRHMVLLERPQTWIIASQ